MTTYTFGWSAYCHGKSESDNPYPPGSDAYNNWYDGYNDARNCSNGARGVMDDDN